MMNTPVSLGTFTRLQTLQADALLKLYSNESAPLAGSASMAPVVGDRFEFLARQLRLVCLECAHKVKHTHAQFKIPLLAALMVFSLIVSTPFIFFFHIHIVLTTQTVPHFFTNRLRAAWLHPPAVPQRARAVRRLRTHSFFSSTFGTASLPLRLCTHLGSTLQTRATTKIRRS